MKKLNNHMLRWKIGGSIVVLVLLAQAVVPVLLPKAHATGALTYSLVRFDRMKASQATTGTVCAKPSSTATETSVKVTFPSSYTVSGTVGNWTTGVTTTGWPKDPADDTTTATAWPSIAAPTGSGEFTISGQSVNFVSGDLTAGVWYCFNWTNTAALSIKSGASADNTGQVITQTTGGVASDTGNYATASVTDDQIAVSASVNATFSFSLSSNSAGLGALSTSSPTAASAINASVSTNAQRGWNIWAADLGGGSAGLHSTTASKTIAYNPSAGSGVATLSTGAEGYNVGAGTTSGTCNGSPAIDANFASGGTSYRGGGLDGTLRSVALADGTAASCLVPLTVNASISGTTPAANDYAGTITVVAAGRF